MKTKKLKRKLSLKKEEIARLNDAEMKSQHGGNPPSQLCTMYGRLCDRRTYFC